MASVSRCWIVVEVPATKATRCNWLGSAMGQRA